MLNLQLLFDVMESVCGGKLSVLKLLSEDTNKSESCIIDSKIYNEKNLIDFKVGVGVVPNEFILEFSMLNQYKKQISSSTYKFWKAAKSIVQTLQLELYEVI